MTRTYTYTTTNNPWLIGFDKMFDRLNSVSEQTSNYPPYNLIRVSEETYRVELAVAGFSREELSVELADGVLKVATGILLPNPADEDAEYLHRGLAKRAFIRRFTLADDVVVNKVSLKDGVLAIDLQRIVPEEKKPRKFDIV